MICFENDWDDLLREEFSLPYFQRLRSFLAEEYRTGTVYPPKKDLFSALRLTAFCDVKAVILGQDPYHEAHQAHGLAFSVPPGEPLPPSLRNICKELQSDCGCSLPDNGCLIPWAKQGVLLLNTVLTVREGKPASHRGQGWEQFTDRVIDRLNQRKKPIVFLLWGNQAQEKEKRITAPQHLCLTAPHPSPLSAHRGFFGCRHFSQTNARLKDLGETPIDWQIPHLF